MRKFMLILVMVIIVALIFIDISKDETFTIIQKESGNGILIKSNKVLKPSYKQATLSLQDVQIVNTSGEEIDVRLLEVGDQIEVAFEIVAGFSDPPVLSAHKVVLLE